MKTRALKLGLTCLALLSLWPAMLMAQQQKATLQSLAARGRSALRPKQPRQQPGLNDSIYRMYHRLNFTRAYYGVLVPFHAGLPELQSNASQAPSLRALFPGLTAHNPANALAAFSKLPVTNPGNLLAARYNGLLSTGKSLFALPSAGSSVKSLESAVPGANTTALVKLPAVPTLTNPGSLLTTTGTAVTGKIQGIQGQVTSQFANTLATRGLLAGQLAQYKAMDDALTKNFRSLGSPSFGATLSVENDLQYNPVQLLPGGSKFQEVAGIRGTLKLLGIPLNVNLSNNQAAFNGQNPFGGNTLFKFGFNPQMYAGLLKNQMQQYADLKNTVFHGFNFTDYVRQTLTEQVRSLQSETADLKKSPFHQLLESPNALQELMKMSDAEVKQKLHALAAEQKSLTTASGATAPLTAEEQQLNQLRADSLAHVISTLKRQLRANGLDPARLVLFENYASGKTAPAFNSSEAASALNDKQPSNALQSIFGVVKDLRIGSFGTTLPGAENGDQSKLMQGASLSVKLGAYPVSFGFGTLNDVNSLKDAAYQTSVYNFPKGISYVSADMPRDWMGNVRVSVVGSFSGPSAYAPYGPPTLPSNAVDFTIAKTLNLQRYGRLEMDFSKSTTLFDNSYQAGSEAILDRKAGNYTDLSTTLFSALAVGFRHNLTIRELDASDNIYFSRSGLGFENPANNGYSGASTKFGGDLKKSFNKNTLVFDFRTDFSNTPMSYTNDDRWKNYQAQLTGSYKLTKTFNISLKYLLNGTEKKTDTAANSVYRAQKLELSANDTYKIGDRLTTIHASIAGQMFRDSYMSAAGSNLLNFNYIQTMLFGTSAVTYTFFANRELSPNALVGNMLTTELAYQYQLSKTMQLTTGANYLDNGLIAEQFGLKQGLQVMASKHIEAGASIDLERNLIRPEYADLFPSVRAELTFKYFFKTE